MTHDESSLQAFEHAMRQHGFSPPERRTADRRSLDPYTSVRDSDRYRGWCMARAEALASEISKRRTETASRAAARGRLNTA